MATVYKINKAINKPIEFRGLKAQYILYLAIGLVILFVVFVILFIAGVNMFACLACIGILSAALFTIVYRMSNKYGQHGLRKKLTQLLMPSHLRVTDRQVFMKLHPKPENEKTGRLQ